MIPRSIERFLWLLERPKARKRSPELVLRSRKGAHHNIREIIEVYLIPIHLDEQDLFNAAFEFADSLSLDLCILLG